MQWGFCPVSRWETSATLISRAAIVDMSAHELGSRQ